MIKSSMTLIALLLLAGSTTAQGLTVKEAKGSLAFFDGDKLVTRYDYQGFNKPIFYPVNAPSGVPLTRGWPMDKKDKSVDHPWQKSAWFCHGDVVAEGLKLNTTRKGIAGTDYWADTLVAGGKIVCTKVDIKKQTRDHITVVTTNEWLSADGGKILDETRVIHVVKLNGAWLVVCESDLFAPTYNIVFDDTKEGAFGIRINDRITAESGKGTITNAEGKTGEKQCWGQVADWCDYSSPIDDKVAGLTTFADPKNPYPSCWHVRAYGLMAANPFGRAKSGFPAMKGRDDVVRLAKGEHLRLRYGMLLHDGDVTTGQVAQQYQRFVDLRSKE